MSELGNAMPPVPAPPSAPAADRARSADVDRELVRRIAEGDEGALGTLYDRWSPLVHALVLRLLQDADEAEDTVEETFWQAWRQAARYEESRGAVSTWLVTIGRSRALDRLRARRRLREDAWSQLGRDEAEAFAERAPAAGDDPLAATEASERRRLVVAALEGLPPEQREIITLAYFGGLSQSEIAERTGLPLGTVKTRTRLAMEKLRDRLPQLRESG